MTDIDEPSSIEELRIRRRTVPGASPGTIVVDDAALPSRMHVFAYSEHDLLERDIEDPVDLDPLLEAWPVVWLNVDGLGDADVLKAIAARFRIHRLALEDVVNVHQRPKVEDYEEQLFVVTRMLQSDRTLDSEQVSLFLGRGYVVTFQERPGDCLEQVRLRLRKNKGKIRTAGTGYLSYSILDAIVDAHFPVLETYGEELEEIEDLTLRDPSREVLTRIHDVKRDLLLIRRAIWPQREMVNRLMKDESVLIDREARIYLRDTYDHTVQLMDLLENYREIAGSLMDVYMSMVSNRMNEVMKMLTVIATIFIPLTFVTGLYGMNFDRERSPWNMPELGWYYGYPFALGLMLGLGIVMYLVSRRKRWLA